MNLMSGMAAAAWICATALAQEVPTKRERPPVSDAQRTQLEQRLNEAWSNLPVREKQQVLRLHRALSEMPPEQRRLIHERIEHFINMTPEERKRLRENAERWKTMTPEQREEARQKFQQKRREFEEKWRKEHPGEEPPPFPFRKLKPSSALEAETNTNQTKESK